MASSQDVTRPRAPRDSAATPLEDQAHPSKGMMRSAFAPEVIPQDVDLLRKGAVDLRSALDVGGRAVITAQAQALAHVIVAAPATEVEAFPENETTNPYTKAI